MHCCCSFCYAGKRSLNISLMKVHAAIIYLLSILVILCGIALAPDAHPTKWFDEKQTVTAYSGLLLYTCAFVSGLNYLTCRTLSHVDPIRRSLKSLWALAIPGFGFLMADEFFVMHEGIGRFLAYRVLRLTASSFADHFDGFVILAYGLVGLAALLYYFRELKQVPCFFTYLAVGAIFAVTSVALDLRIDSAWSIYVEDGAKVLANASFLLACISSTTRDYQELRLHIDNAQGKQRYQKDERGRVVNW
jgi:hypothetical protein